MKIHSGWLALSAWAVVGLLLVCIYALAFAVSLPGIVLFAIAKPLQAWLDHLSQPGRAQ